MFNHRRNIKWVSVNSMAGKMMDVAKFPLTVRDGFLFVQLGGYKERSLWSEQGWKWRQDNSIEFPSYFGDENYVKDKDFPLTGVSFWEAEAMAHFFGGRLPNEYEWWHFATNGGASIYPWGNKEPTEDHVQSTFFGILKEGRLSRVKAHPQGATSGGIFDLLGNVSEWCNPILTEGVNWDSYKVLRGGSSWNSLETLSPAFRNIMFASERDNNTGVRVVCGEEYQPRESSAKRCLDTNRKQISSGRKINRPKDQFRQEGYPEEEKLVRSYQLQMLGEIGQHRNFKVSDLRSEFEIVEEQGCLVCVCGWFANIAVKGVRLFDVISACDQPKEMSQMFLNFTSYPSTHGKVYDTAWEVCKNKKGSPLLVFEINGEPLSLKDGAPLRTLHWDLYGYKHVKSVHSISIDYEPKWGYWEEAKGYSRDGIIQPGTYLKLDGLAEKVIVSKSGRVVI